VGASEGVGRVGRAMRRAFGSVGESVLGFGVAHDAHADALECCHVVGRRVRVAFPDDRQYPIGMTGSEVVERLALARPRPSIGKRAKVSIINGTSSARG
jgi:hypothetical protein